MKASGPMGKKATTKPIAADAPKNGMGIAGRFLGIAAKFEAVADAAAAHVPSPRARMWLDGFFHPEATYDKVEKGASVASLSQNLIIFYFAYSLIFFLFMLALTSSLPAQDLTPMGPQKNPDVAQIAVGSLIVGPIASTITALLAFGLVFISARALGGKGTFAKQANSMSLVLCGSNTLLLAFMCIVFAIFLPSFLLKDSLFLGATASLVAMLASVPIFILCLVILLYSLYAYFLVVRKAHSLPSWRAAGVILIAAALVVVLDAVIARVTGN